MIGWYVHHVGHGHRHRALAVVEHLDQPVTGLSSLPRPDDWPGEWVQLPNDDDGTPVHDPTAGGRLHWAPLAHAGVRDRAAAISAWIAEAHPDVLVVDVSVEVALLARLHGVPVVTMAMPGERGDAAHQLGYDVSSALVAAWPPEARRMLRGVDPRTLHRLHRVGAISRFPVATDPGTPQPRTVVALFGTGGGAGEVDWIAGARAATPDWSWTVLGDSGGGATWTADPWPLLRSASVVVTHAGQNALAEVAASQRPAVVVPQERPHAEQATTALGLTDPRWPAVVVDPSTVPDWAALLERTAALDGTAWSAWCDGAGAARMAAVVAEVAGR